MTDDEQGEEEYSNEDYRTFLLEGAALIAPSVFRVPPARCNCEGKIQLLTEEVSKLHTPTPPDPEWPVVTGACVACLGLGVLLGRWISKWKPWQP